jgi:hypothetical protein
MLVGTVSILKYQQGESPFETRQMFEALSVGDPGSQFGHVQEAVSKVKYQ